MAKNYKKKVNIGGQTYYAVIDGMNVELRQNENTQSSSIGNIRNSNNFEKIQDVYVDGDKLIVDCGSEKIKINIPKYMLPKDSKKKNKKEKASNVSDSDDCGCGCLCSVCKCLGCIFKTLLCLITLGSINPDDYS